MATVPQVIFAGEEEEEVSLLAGKGGRREEAMMELLYLTPEDSWTSEE